MNDKWMKANEHYAVFHKVYVPESKSTIRKGPVSCKNYKLLTNLLFSAKWSRFLITKLYYVSLKTHKQTTETICPLRKTENWFVFDELRQSLP